MSKQSKKKRAEQKIAKQLINAFESACGSCRWAGVPDFSAVAALLENKKNKAGFYRALSRFSDYLQKKLQSSDPESVSSVEVKDHVKEACKRLMGKVDSLLKSLNSQSGETARPTRLTTAVQHTRSSVPLTIATWFTGLSAAVASVYWGNDEWLQEWDSKKHLLDCGIYRRRLELRLDDRPEHTIFSLDAPSGNLSCRVWTSEVIHYLRYAYYPASLNVDRYEQLVRSMAVHVVGFLAAAQGVTDPGAIENITRSVLDMKDMSVDSYNNFRILEIRYTAGFPAQPQGYDNLLRDANVTSCFMDYLVKTRFLMKTLSQVGYGSGFFTVDSDGFRRIIDLEIKKHQQEQVQLPKPTTTGPLFPAVTNGSRMLPPGSTTPFSHGLTSTRYKTELGDQGGNLWIAPVVGSLLSVGLVTVFCGAVFTLWKKYQRAASSPVAHVDQKLPEESPTSIDPLLTAPSHPESATNVMAGNADQLVDRGNSSADAAPEQAGKPGKVARLFGLFFHKSGQAQGVSAAQQEAMSVFYSQPDVESPVSCGELVGGDRVLLSASP